ncbi:MAG: hypothetical protein WC787_03030 [Patescibacteria group bacterium]|jgi:hypothetical protein
MTDTMKEVKLPSYVEILKMEKEPFTEWIIARSQDTYRKGLLEEMIEHEERTGSFKNSARKELDPVDQLVFDIFDRQKSEETIRVLEGVENAAKATGYEGDNVGAVKSAIFAKATSDYFKLGAKGASLENAIIIDMPVSVNEIVTMEHAIIQKLHSSVSDKPWKAGKRS